MRKGTFVVLVCICSLAVAALTPTMADVLPRDYRLEPVMRNLTSPQAMALAPDGRIFYLERTTGNVRVIQQGKLLTDPFVTVSVPASSPEGGLLGIALHPSFASNGWVFLYYTKAANGKNRIERYTASGNRGTSAFVVLDDIGPATVGSGEDNGGGLVFGTDGNLYAGVGVMENDAQAQTDGSYLGKVLQITFNGDGTVAQVNQHAKGFRNVAGLAVNRNTGTLYGTDNYDSDDACDETNVVQSSMNYGWNTASCGDGNQQAPLQMINPQTGVSTIASYTGSRYPTPKVCANDATKQCAIENYCSNDPTKPCFANGACSNNPQKPCTYTKVCSTNATVKCSADADCTSVGGTCIEYCGAGGVCNPYCGAGNTCQPACGWGVACVDAPTQPVFVGGQGSGNLVVRDVLSGASYDTLSSASGFYNPGNDPTAGSCPGALRDLEVGKDGWLYAVSGDASASKAGIYRMIYDGNGGANAAPREVSGSSYFPLAISKDAGNLKLTFEDLKRDAWGCWTGHCPTGTKPNEYSIWSGPLTSPFAYGHTVLGETNGTVENDALLSYTTAAPADSRYYLVSARGSHLEGTLGSKSDGTPRPGYSPTDLCQTIGYGTNSSDMNKCSGDWPHPYPDQNNKLWNFSDFRGKVVVLSMGQYG